MRSKSRPIGLKNTSFIEEARRKQIIDATIEAVSQEGYAGASLAKLAARAKISKSIISYHFAGKDELLEQTVNQIYADIWQSIRPRIEAEETATGKLRGYIEGEFAYLEKQRPQLLTISYILMNHRDSRGRLYLLEDAERRNLETLGGLLELGQKNGEFRNFALRPMAITLISAINGALGQWAADSNLSLAEYAKELTTIFELATRKTDRATKRRS